MSSKVAIITGASEGIGLACALALVKSGCCVSLLGRHETKMSKALDRFTADERARAHSVLGDVKDTDVRRRLVEETIDQFGALDILVNNAGGGSNNRFIEEIDEEDFQQVVSLNLESAFAMCRLAAAHMKRQGFGRIINVASVAGRDAGRLSGPQYAAAKAGMIGMSRHLSRDLGPYGITVNTVAPGFVLTERALAKWNSRSEEERKGMLSGVPVGRFGTPDEIASAVLYFAQDNSGYTNGACLDVNGGSFRA